jgi:hypothetical protein
MNNTLLAPDQWAQWEFALAGLGDQRRTQRLVNVATSLAQSPGGTLPQAFPEWKDLKGAYRFFNQPKVGPEQIQTPHWERTRARCRAPGEYLLVEDTSELDYTGHPATEELGPIGNGGGRGFLLHSTLALAVEAWDLEQRPEGIVVGLFGQRCWTRRGPPKRGSETWRVRIKRRRESQRWAEVFEETGGPPSGSQWIFIADREADFYEPIERCQRHGVDFVIRGYRDRRLVDPAADYLKEAAGRMPVRGRMEVELRARPGQAARVATVEVRSGTVRARGPERPGGDKPDFTVNVVEVREVNATAGVEALHWLLLTSLPCVRWAQVRRIVTRYATRWWVEEYHKALKSGTKVEESQMERGYRIESLVAVLAIVAVRLLNAKWLARARGDEAVDEAVFGPSALAILAALYGRPQGGWTHRSVLVAVARMGGFLARRHDGLPGWETIWRGWQRLIWMCQGLEILKPKGKRCG